MNSGGFPESYITNPNTIQSNGGASVTGDFPAYLSTTGVLLGDTGYSQASFLHIAGGTMTGDVNFDAHEVKNTGHVRPRDTDTFDLGSSTKRYKNAYVSGTLEGDTNGRDVDDIVSCTSSVTDGDVCIFSGVSGKVITDSSIVAADLVTNAGTGAVGNVPIFSADKIIEDSSIVSANIVTNAGTGAVGNVPVFSADKVIEDSKVALTDLATTSSLSSYLPLAGGTMAGDLLMNGHAIDVSVMTNSLDTGIAWGNGATAGGISANAALGYGMNVVGSDAFGFGRSCDVTGGSALALGVGHTNAGFNSSCVGSYCTVPGGLHHTAIGQSSVAGIVGGDIGVNRCLAIGYSASSTGASGIAIGNTAIVPDGGENCIAIGCVATAGGVGADNAIAIGFNCTNATADSFLFGNPNVANIRPNSTVCDLGTSSAKFQTLFLSTNAGLSGSTDFGTGTGVIGIADASVVPSTNPTGGGVLFSDGGSLKWRNPAGLVTTIAL